MDVGILLSLLCIYYILVIMLTILMHFFYVKKCVLADLDKDGVSFVKSLYV